jgi:hypothetical protein
MNFAHENAKTTSTFMFELQTFLVGLWIVGPKNLQVRGFLHVDFGCHLCFMMGKVHGWRTYPNCRATLGYCLI